MPTPKELRRLHEQQHEQTAAKAALQAQRRAENERNAAAKRRSVSSVPIQKRSFTGPNASR
jgi:hypothetical protein